MIHSCAFLCLALCLTVASAHAGTKKHPPAATKQSPPAVSPYIPTDQDLQRYRENPYTPQPLTAEQRAFLTTINTPQRQSGTTAVSSDRLTLEAVTYYCAGQAGILLQGTISSIQMARWASCVDAHTQHINAR